MLIWAVRSLVDIMPVTPATPEGRQDDVSLRPGLSQKLHKKVRVVASIARM